MRAQPRYGLALSWPRSTAVFLIDVAVLALASHWPSAWQTDHIAWWVGVAITVLVTVAAVLTYRRTPLTSALAARVLDRFADPEVILLEGRTPAIDHRRRFARDVVGIREYRGRLVSVIAVDGREDALSGRHRHPTVSSTALPIAMIADGLRQFDLRLDAIDIVSVGRRRSPTDRDGSDHGRAVSDEQNSPIDQRDTWLVLRMDPLRNLDAVAARDSVASALAAATERLAHDLGTGRCAARPLTAAEIAGVDTAVLADLRPAHVRARRRRLKYIEPEGPKEFVTSFWVSPRDITSETLDQLWRSDTDATVLTIRLTPRDGGTEVSAWVRYHTGQRFRKDVWAGLNRLTGRQLVAVCASLPVPRQRSPLKVPARELRDHEELAMPLGRTPQQSPSRAATYSGAVPSR
jgi:type VII secretion protein EccE